MVTPEPKVVPCVQLINLSPERIASIWRKYLDSFATCLLHWGGNPQSPSGLRLERLYWEAGLLWASVQIKHPDRLEVSTFSPAVFYAMMYIVDPRF